jgi:hypothetical protein
MMKKAAYMTQQLNELKANPSVNKDSVKLISRTLEHWQADIVEVPGNDDSHDHQGHNHSHERLPEVTEEQMLGIQKELDERLRAIGKRITSLKPEWGGEQNQ